MNNTPNNNNDYNHVHQHHDSKINSFFIILSKHLRYGMERIASSSMFGILPKLDECLSLSLSLSSSLTGMYTQYRTIAWKKFAKNQNYWKLWQETRRKLDQNIIHYWMYECIYVLDLRYLYNKFVRFKCAKNSHFHSKLVCRMSIDDEFGQQCFAFLRYIRCLIQINC